MTDFATSVDRLLNQVRHWTQPRWSGRGDRVHELAQHLADLAADAEGRERAPVPRLADTVLPDQIRVLADDLLAAAPTAAALAAATAAVDGVRSAAR